MQNFLEVDCWALKIFLDGVWWIVEIFVMARRSLDEWSESELVCCRAKSKSEFVLVSGPLPSA